jgi:hypothetical protein
VIDRDLIEVTRNVIFREQRAEGPIGDEIKQALNDAVNRAYGNPKVIDLVRTGVPGEMQAWEQEQELSTYCVTGQILEADPITNQVRISIDGSDEPLWIALPQNTPGWALDGLVFEADISMGVLSVTELSNRPWALRNFRHTARPYSSVQELEAEYSSLFESNGL